MFNVCFRLDKGARPHSRIDIVYEILVWRSTACHNTLIMLLIQIYELLVDDKPSIMKSI